MRRALVASAALLAAYETTLAVARFRRRERVFAEARARAAQLGRPLIVVGDPDGGAHTRLSRAYGCGDACVDLHGCPLCPVSIEADVTQTLEEFADDSAVVFVSCVLEYVSDAAAAEAELLRIAGHRDRLFMVYVDPWSITSVMYPGARWRGGSPGRWRAVTGAHKGLLAAGLLAGAALVVLRS